MNDHEGEGKSVESEASSATIAFNRRILQDSKIS